MAVRVIATRLAISGETEYKQKISLIKNELQTLSSQLKLTESNFAGQANSMAALTAKGNDLQSLYSKQAEKVKELEAALRNAQTAQQTYATRVTEAKTKIASAESELSKLKTSTGDTTAEQKRLTAEIEKYKKELSEAESYEAAAAKGVNNWQQKINSAQVELNKLDTGIQKNNQYLSEAKNSSDGCATSIDEFGKETNNASESVDALASALAAAGVVATIKEITAALNECSEAFTTFESGISKIQTVANVSQGTIDGMATSIIDLSNDTGIATTDLNEAVYQAISAGVKAGNAVEFVSNAVQLAEGGFTSATSAVDVLTTAINAYGLASEDATSISDMLIMTQNLGKTTVDQLAGSLGSVIPIAAGLGVNIENLSTAYAVLTKNGVKTDEAGTYIRATLNEISDAGSNVSSILKEQTGKSFAELTEAGYSFGDVLGVLYDGVGRNGEEFKNLWGNVRAGTGVLSIVNSGVENFNDVLFSMQNSVGATTKAYATMEDTAEHAQRVFQASAENLKTAIGSQLEPSLASLRESGADAFEWAADFVEENPWVVSAVTALASAVGVLAIAITGYTLAVKVAIPVIKKFNLALKDNPIGLVVTALTALTVAVTAYVATMPKANQETKDFISGLEETKKTAEETNSALAEQADSNAALLSSLDNLVAKEEKTQADKQAILGVVEQLNEAVPELALAYDAEADSLNMSAEAIKARAQAQAEATAYDAMTQRLTNLYVERAEIEQRQAGAAASLAEARQHLAEVEAEYGNTVWEADTMASAAYDNARQAVGDAEDAINMLSGAYSDNADEIENAENKVNDYARAKFNDTATTKANTATTEENTAAAKESVATVKKLSGEVDGLSDALDEQSENGKLSLSTTLDLIDAGYAAALQIDSETGAVTVNKGAYIALAQAKIQDQIATLNSARTSLQDKIAEEGKTAFAAAGDFVILAGTKALASKADQEDLQSIEAQIAALNELSASLSNAAVSTASYGGSAGGAAKEVDDAYTELFDDLKDKFENGEVDLKDFIKESEKARDKYLDENTDAWADSYNEMFDEVESVMSDRLDDIKKDYDDALGDIQDNIDDMRKSLLDVGDITETITVNDQDITQLSNLDEQTSSIEAFGDALQALKDRGISASMLSEIAAMDVAEGTTTANLLLGLTDEKWAEEMAAWEAKQQAAKQIAEAYYAEDMQALNDSLTSAVTGLEQDMTDAGLELGGNITDGIVLAIQDGTINVQSAISKLMLAAQEAAKKADDQHSPSREYRKIASNDVQGLVNEFQDRTPDVVKSVEDMSFAAQNAAEFSVSDMQSAVHAAYAAANRAVHSMPSADSIISSVSRANSAPSGQTATTQNTVADVVNGLAAVMGAGGGSFSITPSGVYLDSKKIGEVTYDVHNDIKKQRGDP